MDSHERRERAAQEAGEWMLRLSSADMARSERIEYVKWLRESALHVAEMLRVAGAHKRLTQFEGWSEIPPADPAALSAGIHQLPHVQAASDASTSGGTRLLTAAGEEDEFLPKGGVRKERGVRPAWIGLAVAASVALLAVALAHFGLLRPNTIVADVGERREVTLSDGTHVRLSPRSRLTVKFTSRERDVVLANGDALFSVAKDPQRPFIAQSGRTRVRAVGTIFGVEHDEGSVVVTVQEGRVAVLHSAAHANSSSASSEPALLPITFTEVSIGADQQIVAPEAGPMSAVRKVDSRRALSWAEGRLVFEEETVAEVVRRFNRFNRVQMKITDPALAARSVTAVFDASDPGAFIVFLESVADVRVTRSSADEILITSEGPR